MTARGITESIGACDSVLKYNAKVANKLLADPTKEGQEGYIPAPVERIGFSYALVRPGDLQRSQKKATKDKTAFDDEDKVVMAEAYNKQTSKGAKFSVSAMARKLAKKVSVV